MTMVPGSQTSASALTSARGFSESEQVDDEILRRRSEGERTHGIGDAAALNPVARPAAFLDDRRQGMTGILVRYESREGLAGEILSGINRKTSRRAHLLPPLLPLDPSCP